MDDNPLIKFINSSKKAARAELDRTLRTRYFPEVWYPLEIFFSEIKNKHVLVLGCGTPFFVEALAKSGWRVTCVDPSLTALTHTKEQLAAAGLAAEYERGEPFKLSFTKHSFAAVVCINLIEFIPEQMRLINEIYRVLMPGGRAVIATFNRMSPWALPPIVRATRLDRRRRPLLCLSRDEFKTLLRTVRLKVEDFKDRARYMPLAIGGRSVKLPVAGAYIALLSKGEKRRRPNGDGQEQKTTPASSEAGVSIPGDGTQENH